MMHHSNIDPKDLRPFKPEELQIGGTFYLKNPDGSFSTCKIFKDELKHRVDNLILTLQYAKEGRVFIRYNKPWKSFV